MNKFPKKSLRISIGICTLNGEKYIKQQLESVINQTQKPDQIVLCDDGSIDKTTDIAKEILSLSGIDYLISINEKRQGLHNNFTKCFDLCNGDIIFSCDQDDVWKPNKIEKFLKYLKNDYLFVYSNAEVVDQNGIIIKSDFWRDIYGLSFSELSLDQYKLLLLKTMCVAGCDIAFRKDLFEKIKPIPYHYIHDSWIAICAPLFGKIAFIDEPLIAYRMHSNNTSGFKVQPQEIKKKFAKGNKHLISDTFRNTSPENWFNKPYHYYFANKEFYEQMESNFTKSYCKTVKSSINYYSDICRCHPGKKILSYGILIKLLISGKYFTFRGNIKQFIKDIIYITFNKNISFVYDTEKW